MTMSVYNSGNPPSTVPAYKAFPPETLSKRDATTKQIEDNLSTSENLATLKSSESPSDSTIDWIPSYRSYLYRSQRRLKQGGLTKALPEGFPARVESPLAWTGSELKKEEYIIELSEEEILEIEGGLRDFKKSKLQISLVTRQTFRLPTLGPRLIDLGASLYNGRGFFVLRGLNPKKYSSEENVLIYVGISCWVAEKRGRQDEHNNMLRTSSPFIQCIKPERPQPYHTDIGDILALYTLGQAYQGGRSKLASAGAIYNELAETRPDHIDTLRSPEWIFDTFGRAGEPYYKRPLLFNQDGKMVFAFSRRILTGSKVSPRTKGIPDMTDAQADALDAVHFTADKHALTLDDGQLGDILFWNNMSIVHARQGFVDGGPINQKRHLLRLWLRNEELAWKTPEVLQSAWRVAYGSDDVSEEKWPIEPIMDRDHVTTQRRSSGHG
ncbi:Clavaminate synthase-like protein [Choiromyces venosus 120613-1]|uniref:Clavaminate synthase-like protein n=1 Tax=Choiromyces venosus 120613-1 TaxID=1336337 RepID=A0A3N4JNY3_9PEZI|nr:Clavaminate synthase-like protein [Choiromyces venosus 120613-1]